MVTRICKILNTIIVTILIILSAIMVGPKLLGGNTLAVLSGSMEPKIPVGSLVIIKKVEPKTLEAGDIITYKISADTLVTHRVVENNPKTNEIITKGDANKTNDSSPINYSNVVGKMLFHVPLLGYLSIYMQTTLGVAIICVIVIILILLNFLPDLVEKDKEIV